jgi:hypothetical protein
MAKVIAVDLEVNTKKAEEGVNNLTDTVGGLSSKLDSATGGAISGFKSMASGLKGVIGGFKTLKGAIIATGIGALVVVVTAAVEWFTKFDAGVKLVSKTMDAFAGGITQLATAFNLLIQGDFSGAADAFTGIASAAADAWQQSDKLFEVTKKLKELQAENIPLNAKLRQELELQKKILEDTTLTEKERLGALNEVTRLSSEIQNNAIKENKLKEEELRLKIKLVDNDEESRDLNIELGRVQAELIDQEGQLNIIRKDAEKVEREIISLTRQKKLTQLEEELKVQKELQDLLKVDAEKDDFQKDIDQLDKLFNLEEEQKNRRIFSKEQEAKVLSDLDKKIEEDQLETLQDADNKAKAIEEGKRRNKEMNALNAANTILGINSLFEGKTEEEQKKAFKRTKALNIASATVETFLAAQKAYTSQIIPLDPTSPVRGALAAAAAIASGLARVAQIKKQKFNGGDGGGSSPITIGGGSSGGGGNGSAGIGFNPSTPTISALPNFATTQAQNNNSGSNVRAYVIQDDINSQTALNKRINQRTKL